MKKRVLFLGHLNFHQVQGYFDYIRKRKFVRQYYAQRNFYHFFRSKKLLLYVALAFYWKQLESTDYDKIENQNIQNTYYALAFYTLHSVRCKFVKKNIYTACPMRNHRNEKHLNGLFLIKYYKNKHYVFVGNGVDSEQEKDIEMKIVRVLILYKIYKKNKKFSSALCNKKRLVKHGSQTSC